MALKFAGVVWTNGEKPRIAEEIARILEPTSGGDLFEDRSDTHYFRAIGWHGDPGASVRSSGGRLTVCNGDPVFSERIFAQSDSRDQEVDYLHANLLDRFRDILPEANGSFCAVSVDTAGARVVAATDKYGIYPLFYMATEDFFAFSTSIAIASLPVAGKAMDETGMAEIVALGHNLSDHTPYQYVRRLYGGTAVDAAPPRCETAAYWRLIDTKPFQGNQSDFEQTLFDLFSDGIRRRLRKLKRVNAFLSGGLDSRCVVAGLRAAGAQVQTYNRSAPGSLDDILGGEIAAKLDTHHIADTAPVWSGDFWEEAAQKVTDTDFNADHPYEIWSGEGGSVCMGHVYVTPELVAAGSGGTLGNPEGLAKYGIFGPSMLPSIFEHDLRTRWANLSLSAVAQEFQSVKAGDGKRDIYAWLVLNEQAHHLDDFFENVEHHRMTAVLPFFDGRVIEAVYSAPIEWFLGHRLYHSWLHRFQPPVAQTAWQPYPRHDPCPLPLPEGKSQFVMKPRRMSHVRQLNNEAARRCLAGDTGGRIRKGALFYHYLMQRLHAEARDWVWRKTGRIIQAQKWISNE